ncbi:serine protease [Arcticibacter sp. MXS-1]|uniref:S1 family peptidase n=1 Tax=Arcticibacter sp. MXS-1 TaxID=3341726 RepID=UPI0035A8C850
MSNFNSRSDFLSYCTVRIESVLVDGNQSVGSGFFFNFCHTGNQCCPTLITNKHVIRGASSSTIVFTLADKEGNPIDSYSHKIIIQESEKAWKLHPDPEIDLCAMPIAQIIKSLNASGINVFYTALDASLVPNESQLRHFQTVEDVIMVGYPNGLWDQANNKPIFRRGITATHPNRDYLGKKQFLIDAACFPGSSGSPVFLVNEHGYVSDQGTHLGARRFLLLGILFAGPQHVVQGPVHFNTNSVAPFALTKIPNNLGIVIKWTALDYFEGLFREELKKLEQ